MLPKDKQLAFILILITLFGCGIFYFYLTTKGIDVSKYQLVKLPNSTQQKPVTFEKSLAVSSSAFSMNETIPDKYTCKDKNISPPLKIQNIPSTAKTLLVMLEDPDAPYKTWTHWIVANIAITKTGSVEILENTIPKGAELGQNDWGKGEYEGPCPPIGQHSYVFKVYALDIALQLSQGKENKQLSENAKGHVVGYGELVGKFSK